MAGLKQPADKSHFLLPDLGEGVHEAELIKWRVTPGKVIKEMDILAEMETDKALVEVPSPWGGTIKELCGKEGEIMHVGKVLVRYDIGGGAKAAAPVAAAPAAKAAAPAAPAAAAAKEGEDAGTVVGNVSGTLTVSDRFARRAAEHVDAATTNGKTLATPAVRRIARELRVDINRIPGTGRGGRVTAGDIERAATGKGPSAAPVARASAAPAERSPAPAPVISGDGIAARIPFRGVRRKIAQALVYHHTGFRAKVGAETLCVFHAMGLNLEMRGAPHAHIPRLLDAELEYVAELTPHRRVFE